MSNEKWNNEELCQRVQQGDRDALLPLWKQCFRYAVKVAANYRGEDEDKLQNAFLALILAARSYDPAGGRSFIGWYDYHLKNALRYKKQLDAMSLDVPLYDDAEETLSDIVADDSIPPPEDGIFRSELRDILDGALSRLDAEQRDIIIHRYEKRLDVKKTAAATGRAVKDVRRLEAHGLTALRNDAEIRRLVDDATPWYARGGRPVEYITMRRDELRDKYLHK